MNEFILRNFNDKFNEWCVKQKFKSTSREAIEKELQVYKEIISSPLPDIASVKIGKIDYKNCFIHGIIELPEHLIIPKQIEPSDNQSQDLQETSFNLNLLRRLKRVSKPYIK